MLSFVISAVLAGASAQPLSMPAFFDSAALAAVCVEGDSAGARQATCLGYIAGSIDQLLMQQAVSDTGARSFCLPPGAALDTAARAVLLRISWASVVGRGVSAAGFVKAALEEAFPCRRTGDDM